MIKAWIEKYGIDVGQKFYIDDNPLCRNKVFLVDEDGKLLERDKNDLAWSYSKIPINVISHSTPSILLLGDIYYYPSLDSGEVKEVVWSNCWQDKHNAKLHLVFNKREDAELALLKIQYFCIMEGAV